MRCNEYLAAALRLYLEAPDTPSRPSRRDRALAHDLCRQGVPLDHLAHAIRIATLRRRLGHRPQPEPIHSLAYYRTVLERLTAEDLDPGYIDYVQQKYRRLRPNQQSNTQTAASKPEPRAF
ncbi:MAG: hypothetical protein IH936_04895 [Acidobacteria bacterium]|nr:hypothetical protein [Acidobacteriota bacterium]